MPQTIVETRTCVLVVEDHDELRRSIISALQKSGIPATGVFCAEEVTEALLGDVPDIYVVDIGLPGENGLSLASRVRERQPDAGIIILTADAALNSKLHGYQSGADVYLAKPVDVEELVAVIRSLARRLRSQLADATEAIIDPDNNLLSGPKANIHLSEPEKRALVRFSLSKQMTLERWELMEAFGSLDAPVSPRSLEVRIAALRKKISDAVGNETNPIIGIRGTGYRLSVPVKLK